MGDHALSLHQGGGPRTKPVDLTHLRAATFLYSFLALDDLHTLEDLGESTMALGQLLESRAVPPEEVVQGLLLGVARYALGADVSPESVVEILSNYIQIPGGE